MNLAPVEDALGSHPFIDLAASGPDPEHRDEMALFGQFIGSWDIEMVSMPPGKLQDRFIAEWHFGWALEGRAVQDVLITRRPSGELVGYGSTVRSFDRRRGSWWIVWQDPLAGEFAVLLARQEGGDIVLEGQWTLGAPNARFRWTFHNIQHDSFEWSGHVASDADSEWQLVEHMQATRRN
jgi:hypothetical protein